MKKLIFRKFTQDTLVFFITSILVMGLIVWTLQAVNYFDYVTKDGHGLKVYFYSMLNFPKIINRILPFIFYLSVLSNQFMRSEMSYQFLDKWCEKLILRIK